MLSRAVAGQIPVHLRAGSGQPLRGDDTFETDQAALLELFPGVAATAREAVEIRDTAVLLTDSRHLLQRSLDGWQPRALLFGRVRHRPVLWVAAEPTRASSSFDSTTKLLRLACGSVGAANFAGCSARRSADQELRSRRLIRVSIADIPRSRSGLISAARPRSE